MADSPSSSSAAAAAGPSIPQLPTRLRPGTWSGSRPEPRTTTTESVPMAVAKSPVHIGTSPRSDKREDNNGEQTGSDTGFKIRIPRDLPNIPDAFRKQSSAPTISGLQAVAMDSRSLSAGAETPTSIASLDGSEPIKRSHSEMLSTEPESTKMNFPIFDKKRRVASSSRTISGSPSQRSPVIPSTPSTAATTSIPAGLSVPEVSQAEGANLSALQPLGKRRSRSRTQSGANSPAMSPPQANSPSLGGGLLANSGEVAFKTESAPSPRSFAVPTVEIPIRVKRSPSIDIEFVNEEASDAKYPELTPMELVRVGTMILDTLLSDPICSNFVNRVPPSLTVYHSVIKNPMDLTTVEAKLWKSLDVHQTMPSEPSTPALTAATDHLHLSAVEGYTGLQDFENDLQLIFQNAVHFNNPGDPVHKHAQAFKVLYTALLNTCREGQLDPESTIPQEVYSPSTIPLCEPGTLYICRAQNLREMRQKMTDMSVELYTSFHQPLMEVTQEIGQLTEDKPRFVRLYISKNRRALYNCRDEPGAKLAIVSDMSTGKPYITPIQYAADGTTVVGGGEKVIRLTARVLIGKPVGEGHDLSTVGDLDCPSTWIMVACVKAIALDVEVSARYEKGGLTKMRSEVISLGPGTKMRPDLIQILADAMGLQLGVSARGSTGSISLSPPPSTPSNARSSIPVSRPPSQRLQPPSAVTLNASHGDGNISAGSTRASSSTEGTLPPSRPPQPSRDSKRPASSPLEAVHLPQRQAVLKSDDKKDGLGIQAPRPLRLPVARFSPPVTKAISVPRLTNAATPEVATLTRSGSRISSNQAASTTIAQSKGPLPEVEFMELDSEVIVPLSSGSSEQRALTRRELQLLRDLKVAAHERHIPYTRWSDIEPTLTVDTAFGLFKRIYHVQGNDDLVVQNFKEMDVESFEQRVREVACLLKLRGLEGIGQIQSVIDDEKDQLVGLSMTKYEHTLKAYATNARRAPSPHQKLSLVHDMVAAISTIHAAGLAHRDLSEVNIMIDEDPVEKLRDGTPRPWVRVIDFGKSVFVEAEEVKRWSMLETVPEEELAILPLVILPPDHGYKLYRSILTLPRSKADHAPLPPVDPRSEDVYSLGVLIWRTFSGKSPWAGAIEDDIRAIRYLVSTDHQIKFHIGREVEGVRCRELLLRCLTAQAETRCTAQQILEWMETPEVLQDLLQEFEIVGAGRKRVKKNLD